MTELQRRADARQALREIWVDEISFTVVEGRVRARSAAAATERPDEVAADVPATCEAGLTDYLRNAVALSHLFLRERIRPGDRVVDATCGNGHDTLFLAELVGVEGQVFAFDIQEQALEKTRRLLEEHGCLARVQLVHAGHQNLATCVTEPVQGVVFNLGYLPGSNKCCITTPETTLAALEQAAALLGPGGILVVVVYPGHEGGAEEAAAVEGWFGALPAQTFNAWSSRQANRQDTAPFILMAGKVA